MAYRVIEMHDVTIRKPKQLWNTFTYYQNWHERHYLDTRTNTEIVETTRRDYKGKTIRYWSTNENKTDTFNTLSDLLYTLDLQANMYTRRW